MKASTTIWVLQILTAMIVLGCSSSDNDTELSDDSSSDADADTDSDTDTDADSDTGDAIPEGMGVVEGVVTDGDGLPVAKVKVRVGDTEAVTDFGGRFSIEADAGDAVLTFAKTGFSESAISVHITEGAATPIQKGLLKRTPPIETNIDDGETVGDSARVKLAPKTLVTEDGDVVTGTVKVSITPVDVKRDLGVAPGDFSASDKEGNETRLETFAMAEYYFEDTDGKRLQVADGKKVTVEMDIPDGLDAKEGDFIPAWSFDSETGKWKEEGEGEIVASDDGTLKWMVEVTHFSWWNADKPIEEKDCVSGVVTDCNGAPVRGVSIRAKGVDYNGESSGFGDADGEYCVDIKRGSTAEFVVVGKVNNRVIGKQVTVTGEGAGASCEEGGCSTQDIELACDPAESDLDCSDSPLFSCDACLSGRIVDPDDNALENAVVELEDSVFGFRAEAITDNDGMFAVTSPKDVEVTLTVNAAGFAPYTLTATASQEGQPPDCEDLGDIAVEEKGSGDTVYEACNTADITLEATDLDGADEAFGDLPHIGMMIYSAESGGDLVAYLWMTDASDPDNTDGTNGLVVIFNIPASNGAGSVESTQGFGSYNAGGVIGVNSDVYLTTASTITWNEAITGDGQSLTGDLALEFTTTCGTAIHTLKYSGTYSTEILGMMDIASSEQCFDFLSAAVSGVEFDSLGTLTLAVEGTAVNLTASKSEYNVADDQLYLFASNDSVYFYLTTNGPVFGEQNISNVSYEDSLTGCSYAGYDIPSVTIDANDEGDLAVGPLSGSFSAEIPISEATDGCPDTVTVTGEMLAAVCAQFTK